MGLGVAILLEITGLILLAVAGVVDPVLIAGRERGSGLLLMIYLGLVDLGLDLLCLMLGGR
jgi:hypothetical protein